MVFSLSAVWVWVDSLLGEEVVPFQSALWLVDLLGSPSCSWGLNNRLGRIIGGAPPVLGLGPMVCMSSGGTLSFRMGLYSFCATGGVPLVGNDGPCVMPGGVPSCLEGVNIIL